jgi:outer membrane protein assembly factor BamD (BamD/ComL family)
MKSGISIILFAMLIMTFISCSNKMSELDYYNKANELMSSENWEGAEENFQKILDNYPKGEHSAKALFMIGFINANYTNNLEKARKYYTKFLEKYPDHDLADDAKYEIENLGKNIEDLPFLQDEAAQNADTANKNNAVKSSK